MSSVSGSPTGGKGRCTWFEIQKVWREDVREEGAGSESYAAAVGGGHRYPSPTPRVVVIRRHLLARRQ